MHLGKILVKYKMMVWNLKISIKKTKKDLMPERSALIVHWTWITGILSQNYVIFSIKISYKWIKEITMKVVSIYLFFTILIKMNHFNYWCKDALVFNTFKCFLLYNHFYHSFLFYLHVQYWCYHHFPSFLILYLV